MHWGPRSNFDKIVGKIRKLQFLAIVWTCEILSLGILTDTILVLTERQDTDPRQLTTVAYRRAMKMIVAFHDSLHAANTRPITVTHGLLCRCPFGVDVLQYNGQHWWDKNHRMYNIFNFP